MPQRWLNAALAAGGIALGGLILLAGGTPHPADAAMTQAPVPSAPAHGATLTNFSPTLQWTLPAGTVQYQMRVLPPDGPAINVIRNAESSYAIPAPPAWYGLLPDMSYTWQVRASDATTSIGEDHASWGPWSESRTFRTPKVSSGEMTLVSPASGSTTTGFLPTLTWETASPAIWYVEVQVSKDATFTTDPARATAAVYWELRHGGVTEPPNSYTIPASFPLEPDSLYSWRVRPRVQGDGAELPWTAPATFRTPAATALFLQVTSPADQSTVTTATLTVTGKTQAGAIVTVNADLATVDAQGNFTATITLSEGINTIDVLASDSEGNTVSTVLTVNYLP